MTSTPFPSFLKTNVLDIDGSSAFLAAVGQCRIYPQLYSDDDNKDDTTAATFSAILAKTMEQSQEEQKAAASESNEAEHKKLAKKYMKQSVALAQAYLCRINIDVSVVDVQVYVDAAYILDSHGCLASCWLDAGCHQIVTQGDNLNALEAARIPRERLCAHLEYKNGDDDAALEQQLDAVQAHCQSVSIRLSKEHSTEIFVLQLMEKLMTNCDLNVILQVDPRDIPGEDLARVVGAVCQAGNASSRNNARGTVSLIDPTATQLGQAYAACIKTDRPDGLYSTVVSSRSGQALGLVYSSVESIVAALACGRGVYFSRSRQQLWRKGDSSGHYQTLHRIDVDCDGDAVRFTVTQNAPSSKTHGGAGDEHSTPAFCHLNTLTCWGPPRGILHLQETLQQRLHQAPAGSYTRRLLEDSLLLRDKLVEEAGELADANTKTHVAQELADVLYFAMVQATKFGVTMDDAIVELDKRARKVTRRPGNSKVIREATTTTVTTDEATTTTTDKGTDS